MYNDLIYESPKYSNEAIFASLGVYWDEEAAE